MSEKQEPTAPLEERLSAAATRVAGLVTAIGKAKKANPVDLVSIASAWLAPHSAPMAMRAAVVALLKEELKDNTQEVADLSAALSRQVFQPAPASFFSGGTDG